MNYEERELKKQADQMLKYAIDILKGTAYGGPWKIRKGDAIDTKRELTLMGMGWHAETLDHWINFYQREENDKRRLASQTTFTTALGLMRGQPVTAGDTSPDDNERSGGGDSLD